MPPSGRKLSHFVSCIAASYFALRWLHWSQRGRAHGWPVQCSAMPTSSQVLYSSAGITSTAASTWAWSMVSCWSSFLPPPSFLPFFRAAEEEEEEEEEDGGGTKGTALAFR